MVGYTVFAATAKSKGEREYKEIRSPGNIEMKVFRVNSNCIDSYKRK